jgi:hypothetical protein
MIPPTCCQLCFFDDIDYRFSLSCVLDLSKLMPTRVQQPSRTPSSTDAPSSKRSKTFIDPNALMRIKDLQMRAKVVVEGFFSGLHRSPYHGFSVEFSEYREYSPGDDTRYLDWRLFARSDRYYIKRFEDETNLRCHLVVDMSRSMDYGSLAYNKADYARTIAATLAGLLFVDAARCSWFAHLRSRHC